MWCSACQQDVPGIGMATDDATHVRCARCSGILNLTVTPADSAVSGAENSIDNEASPLVSSAGKAGRSPLNLDDWRLDDELRDVRKLLRVLQTSSVSIRAPHRSVATVEAGSADMTRRLAEASGATSSHGTRSVPAALNARRAEAAVSPKRKRRSSFFAWTALSLGTMMFVCGGVLLAWSYMASRPELWSLGMPLALTGQAGLVIGLVLQLESLWQSSRDNTSTLDDLNTQLCDLRQTAKILNTGETSAAASHDTHLLDGASPQLLLADLKGELDLLTTRLSK